MQTLKSNTGKREHRSASDMLRAAGVAYPLFGIERHSS